MSADVEATKFSHHGLTKSVLTLASGAQVCSYIRGLHDASQRTPILVLIHGYPQTSYLWRHLIPLLPASLPLFVADIPGYGQSSPPREHSKEYVGSQILQALGKSLEQHEIKPSAAAVVLIGHDRGARICHRLAVNAPLPSCPQNKLNVKGVCLIDIVPTLVQWESFANSAGAVGSYHWAFLANVDLAVGMIRKFGIGEYVESNIRRWRGTSKEGIERLDADDALKVYRDAMERDGNLEASCRDYEAGAGVDVRRQKEDQEAGLKIEIPTLLLYSEDYLGARYDIGKVWDAWVGRGVDVTVAPVGGGCGHFVPEEAPEQAAKHLLNWLESIAGDSHD